MVGRAYNGRIDPDVTITVHPGKRNSLSGVAHRFVSKPDTSYVDRPGAGCTAGKLAYRPGFPGQDMLSVEWGT